MTNNNESNPFGAHARRAIKIADSLMDQIDDLLCEVADMPEEDDFEDSSEFEKAWDAAYAKAWGDLEQVMGYRIQAIKEGE